MPSGKRVQALSGFYLVALQATFMAMLVILLMNLATPFEFSRNRISEIMHDDWQGIMFFRFGLLILVTSLACAPLLAVLKYVLKPVHSFLDLNPSQAAGEQLRHKARKRLLNLPFIIVPVNLVLWAVIPAIVFTAAFHIHVMDYSTAVTFAIRSGMVGIMSSAILFFHLEAHARHALIPLFFQRQTLSGRQGKTAFH